MSNADITISEDTLRGCNEILSACCTSTDSTSKAEVDRPSPPYLKVSRIFILDKRDTVTTITRPAGRFMSYPCLERLHPRRMRLLELASHSQRTPLFQNLEQGRLRALYQRMFSELRAHIPLRPWVGSSRFRNGPLVVKILIEFLIVARRI